MAISARAIRAGAAYVELLVNDSKMMRGLAIAQRKFRAWGASMTAIGTRLGALGLGIGAGFVPAIKAASNLEETMNKFVVVFGKNADAVKGWGDEYAQQVGRSKRQVADFLASNQDLLVPAGIDPAAAIEMSKQITKLAVDLASFNNLADDTVLRDLQAALTGSGETMKKYGVIVNVANVKQELLNKSLDPQTASDQQKVMARLALIMRGTTAAQGDAIRSADSFANQLKAVQGSAEDAGGVIGGALLPVITPLVATARAYIETAGKWISENKGLVVSIAKLAAVVFAAGLGLVIVGTLFGAVGGIIGGIMTVITGAAAAFAGIGAAVAAMLSPMGLVTAGVGVLAGTILAKSGLAGKALEWLKEKFGVLKTDALAAFGAIKNAMAAGDMELAAKILWSTLKLQWQRGVNFLRQKWFEWGEQFLRIGTDAAFGLASVFNNVWANLRVGWGDLVSWLSMRFIDFGGSVMRTWNTVSGFIRKAWAKVKAAVTGTSAAADVQRIEAETRAANQRESSIQSGAKDIIQEDAKRRQREIDAERHKLDSELFDKARDINENRQKAFEAAMADDEAELGRLKDQWQSLIDEGNAKSPVSAGGPGAGGNSFEEQIANAMKAFDTAARSINKGVELGTVEAQKSILDALNGRNDPQADIAKNTQKTAEQVTKSVKELKKMNDQPKLKLIAVNT